MTDTVFDQDASFWWDQDGPFKMLHRMNPMRIDLISKNIDCLGKKVLDIGCGGGLLAESLAELGADVTAIDSSQASIDVAQAHAKLSRKSINYIKSDFLQFAKTSIAKDLQFDVITAMEMIEHIDNPKRYLEGMSHMLKPGGFLVLSTLNRTWLSFLGGIIAAEYLLGWVQKGTHQYSRFIKPSELMDMAYDCNLGLKKLQGLTWEFGKKRFVFSQDVSINYFVILQKRILS